MGQRVHHRLKRELMLVLPWEQLSSHLLSRVERLGLEHLKFHMSGHFTEPGALHLVAIASGTDLTKRLIDKAGPNWHTITTTHPPKIYTNSLKTD